MEQGKTITSNYYVNNCLNPVLKEIIKQRPTSGATNMKFLHDNARPHVTKEVISYLDEAGIKIVPHPPYSPDLAPSDFWLIDYVKTLKHRKSKTSNYQDNTCYTQRRV
jgi:transposase